MSYESISRLSQLTGMTRETVAKRLVNLTPTIDGKAKKYDSREALPLLYGAGAKGEFDLQAERARLAHHQANLECLTRISHTTIE